MHRTAGLQGAARQALASHLEDSEQQSSEGLEHLLESCLLASPRLATATLDTFEQVLQEVHAKCEGPQVSLQGGLGLHPGAVLLAKEEQTLAGDCTRTQDGCV